MCLLTQQTSASKFSDEFLADVYNKNQDGLGIMYGDGEKIHVFKCLPANAQEFIDFYRAHADGKDCVWHARMQTHGDIDFDNCHPYKVTDDIWLAHNGILSTGNDWDKSKSDTWHFIDKFLRPALSANTDLIEDDNWINFVGELIGRQNKFGIVRSDGYTAIVNAHAGVNYNEAWLSNTYAWSYYKFTNKGVAASNSTHYMGSNYVGGGYTDMYTNYRGSRSSYRSAFGEIDDSLDTDESATRVVKGEYVNNSGISARQVAPYVRAAYNSYTRRGRAGIEQWVFDAPHKAATLLAYWYDEIEGIEDLVNSDPDTAADWIADLFASDSISPSMLN